MVMKLYNHQYHRSYMCTCVVVSSVEWSDSDVVCCWWLSTNDQPSLRTYQTVC